jgi:hypothetical protein
MVSSSGRRGRRTGVLTPHDDVKEAEMSSLRCIVGRHEWLAERNPDQGGPDAITEVCARCGKDRPVYQPTSGTWMATGMMRGPR